MIYDGRRVVMTRTPLRLSFVGGGTDIPQYYKKHEFGAVVSAAMDRYIYVVVAKHFQNDKIKISYSRVESDLTDINRIKHPKVREALKLLDIPPGLQINVITEIPSKGTGVGSSSSFTVGLLNALHTWKDEKVSKKTLAEESVEIERAILKEAGGKQDNYIATYGGIQYMRFNEDESVEMKEINISGSRIKELNRNLLLLYTNRQRSSASIHEKQADEVDLHIKEYNRMKELAKEQYAVLSNGSLADTGKLLHENWTLKTKLTNGISNNWIDGLYRTALKNGATGGKIMGGGRSGFLLLYAPKIRHSAILKALPELVPEPFSFDFDGSKVVYSQ